MFYLHRYTDGYALGQTSASPLEGSFQKFIDECLHRFQWRAILGHHLHLRQVSVLLDLSNDPLPFEHLQGQCDAETETSIPKVIVCPSKRASVCPGIR